jgi:hypothetical protein
MEWRASRFSVKAGSLLSEHMIHPGHSTDHSFYAFLCRRYCRWLRGNCHVGGGTYSVRSDQPCDRNRGGYSSGWYYLWKQRFSTSTLEGKMNYRSLSCADNKLIPDHSHFIVPAIRLQRRRRKNVKKYCTQPDEGIWTLSLSSYGYFHPILTSCDPLENRIAFWKETGTVWESGIWPADTQPSPDSVPDPLSASTGLNQLQTPSNRKRTWMSLNWKDECTPVLRDGIQSP